MNNGGTTVCTLSLEHLNWQCLLDPSSSTLVYRCIWSRCKFAQDVRAMSTLHASLNSLTIRKSVDMPKKSASTWPNRQLLANSGVYWSTFPMTSLISEDIIMVTFLPSSCHVLQSYTCTSIQSRNKSQANFSSPSHEPWSPNNVTCAEGIVLNWQHLQLVIKSGAL